LRSNNSITVKLCQLNPKVNLFHSMKSGCLAVGYSVVPKSTEKNYIHEQALKEIAAH